MALISSPFYRIEHSLSTPEAGPAWFSPGKGWARYTSI